MQTEARFRVKPKRYNTYLNGSILVGVFCLFMAILQKASIFYILGALITILSEMGLIGFFLLKRAKKKNVSQITVKFVMTELKRLIGADVGVTLAYIEQKLKKKNFYDHVTKEETKTEEVPLLKEEENQITDTANLSKQKAVTFSSDYMKDILNTEEIPNAKKPKASRTNQLEEKLNLLTFGRRKFNAELNDFINFLKKLSKVESQYGKGLSGLTPNKSIFLTGTRPLQEETKQHNFLPIELLSPDEIEFFNQNLPALFQKEDILSLPDWNNIRHSLSIIGQLYLNYSNYISKVSISTINFLGAEYNERYGEMKREKRKIKESYEQAYQYYLTQKGELKLAEKEFGQCMQTFKNLALKKENDTVTLKEEMRARSLKSDIDTLKNRLSSSKDKLIELRNLVKRQNQKIKTFAKEWNHQKSKIFQTTLKSIIAMLDDTYNDQEATLHGILAVSDIPIEEEDITGRTNEELNPTTYPSIKENISISIIKDMLRVYTERMLSELHKCEANFRVNRDLHQDLAQIFKIEKIYYDSHLNFIACEKLFLSEELSDEWKKIRNTFLLLNKHNSDYLKKIESIEKKFSESSIRNDSEVRRIESNLKNTLQNLEAMAQNERLMALPINLSVANDEQKRLIQQLQAIEEDLKFGIKDLQLKDLNLKREAATLKKDLILAYTAKLIEQKRVVKILSDEIDKIGLSELISANAESTSDNESYSQESNIEERLEQIQPESLPDLFSDIHTFNNTAWLNKLLFVFANEWSKSAYFKQLMIETLFNLLNKDLPKAFRRINIKDLILEPKAPEIKTCTPLPSEKNEFLYDIEISYNGNFFLEIETKLDTNAISSILGDRLIPILVKIFLKSIHGKVRVCMVPSDLGTSWFSFVGHPSIDLIVEPRVGSNQYNISALPQVNNIVSGLVKRLIQTMTFPHRTELEIPLAFKPPKIEIPPE